MAEGKSKNVSLESQMKKKPALTDDRRKRWFADPRLQCGMLARVILYWLYSVSAMGAMGLIWIWLARRPQSPAQWWDLISLNFGPLVVGSLVILPLLLLDCLRFSRRFAGPMVRCRRALRDLANGDPVEKVTLRQNDFWYEFARDVNQLEEQLREYQTTRAKTNAPARHDHDLTVGVMEQATGVDRAAETDVKTSPNAQGKAKSVPRGYVPVTPDESPTSPLSPPVSPSQFLADDTSGDVSPNSSATHVG